MNPGAASRGAVRSFCGDLPALLRAVGFRDIEGNLSCVMGIGSDAWDRLFGAPRPAELHPFREIQAGSRHAVSTPGDLLFHIRAKRMDLCFELATQIMARLGDAVSPVDEVHGFRYFDDRDLIGFVDGTENPTGQAAIDAALCRRRGCRVRRRQLRDRAEISARSGRLERAVHRSAGAHHRPHQAVRHRTRRRGQADIRPQRADHDRRERQGDEDPSRQHAVRQRRAGRIRHLFHRLRAFAADHRADAGQHVRRPAAGQLRSVAGFQPRRDRQSVLRAVRDVPRERRRRRARRSCGACRNVRRRRRAAAAPARDGSLGIGSLKGDPSHE